MPSKFQEQREKIYERWGIVAPSYPASEEVVALRKVGPDLARDLPDEYPKEAATLHKLEANYAAERERFLPNWRAKNADIAHSDHEKAVEERIAAWAAHEPGSFYDPETLAPVVENFEKAADIVTRHYRREKAGELSALNSEETLAENIAQRNQHRMGRR